MTLADSRTLRGCTFLVVEDDEGSRESLRDLLEVLGADVMVAADGIHGLAQLARLRSDAVLCDLVMPRMDGLEFARRLRADPRYRAVLLVAVTGREDTAAVQDTWEHGFDAHLVKPITSAMIETIVRRVAGRCSRGQLSG